MIIIYSTYPNKDEAMRVSKMLVEARLVACANVLPAHQSLYHWDGAVQDEQEVAVIYKSEATLFEQVKEAIVEAHPYDVPCVVCWDIKDGHAPFLEWIGDQTKGA